MGPFPTTMWQFKFLVVEIDYFIKWVEAEPLDTIMGKHVRDFIWKSIICHFGIPRVFISDNHKQFDKDAIKNFCQ